MLAIALSSALLAAAAPAGAQRATTAPGVLYVVRVTIVDGKVTIKDRAARDGVPTYPRGAQIRYLIQNRGTRPYALRIWDHTTPPIAPGKYGSALITWTARGVFNFAALSDGKPAGPRGEIIVY